MFEIYEISNNKNMKTVLSGKVFINGKFKSFANAHLSYKGKSIIIDYERKLHCGFYYEDLDDNEVLIEVYPYKGDIYCHKVKLDEEFKKVDLSDLIRCLEDVINNEDNED